MSQELTGHGDSVSVMIAGLKKSDETAANLLWRRFFQKLVGFSNKLLQRRSKSINDAEDIALSVFKSLCLGAAQGRFEQMSDENDLRRILVALARRKVIDAQRSEQRLKRDARRNVTTDASNLPDMEPTPELLAAIRDQQQHLFALLRDDSLRDVARAKMNGDTNEEIAARMNVTVRTIERKLRLIREQWAHEQRRAVD